MYIHIIIIYILFFNIYLSATSFQDSKFLNLDITLRHFISFEYKKNDTTSSSKFISKRNYLTFKSFFKNSKNHIRFTIDSYLVDSNQNYNKDSYGSWNMRTKYAYLYLHNIFPYTGVKIGETHRPWLDFEGKNSWFHRSVDKNPVEHKNSINLTGSSDFGINFITKLKNFSSELGIFNGEGYHGIQEDNHLSYEWRLTGHILGRGDKKVKTSNKFSNISFFGQNNSESGKHNNKDLNWFGVHFVYNQKSFLISTQIIKVHKADILYKGTGFSINSDYRINTKISIFGRYDYFKFDEYNRDKKLYIYGADYKYDKNIIFIISLFENRGKGLLNSDKYKKILFTIDVKW